MDLTNKTILVLGGWGLVGSAVCRRLLLDRPARLIVTSLRAEEAQDAVEKLRASVPDDGGTEFIGWGGNLFGREDDRFVDRETLLSNATTRRRMIDDVLDDLSTDLLQSSALYRLLVTYRPDAVVDAINTATAIAYQDVYSTARAVERAFETNSDPRAATERLLATLYVPQLIRHVQILYRGMKDAATTMYVKIGTAGAGGMGLNIPYTHSEERPSRVLLSKSSIAGAHTLLLFLMARTPDGPIVKEVKPTATIAWKRIEYGEVLRRGSPIPLVDCPPESAVSLSGSFELAMPGLTEPLGEMLTAPFIDTGENGIFSRGEFEAITSLQQMEMITPEEIAESVVFELKGGNSGHDVVAALDGSVYGPTYRGGYMRQRALSQLQALEAATGVASIAFEMLGPPRLSKLLFEAYILGLVGGSMDGVIEGSAASIAEAANSVVRTNRDLRSRAISIGIPILLADGRTLLRGDTVKIPPQRGDAVLDVTAEHVDAWAAAGWIDLRETNIVRWQDRFRRIKGDVLSASPDDTSSRTNFSQVHWEDFRTMPVGKIAAWVFTIEDEGSRMKA